MKYELLLLLLSVCWSPDKLPFLCFEEVKFFFCSFEKKGFSSFWISGKERTGSSPSHTYPYGDSPLRCCEVSLLTFV